MRAAQGLSAPPAILVARLREPTAIAASADTVIAVPSAIANAAKTPAHIIPIDDAKISTRIAPLQGRMPIDSASVQASLHDHAPASADGGGK